MSASIWNPTTSVSELTEIVSSIAELRGVTASVEPIFVAGYYTKGDGGGGWYYHDSADTTSADNGGTIIIAFDSKRWKLIVTDFVSIKQFGARGDGILDDYTHINNAFTAVTGNLLCPPSTYKITGGTGFTINSDTNILGKGAYFDFSAAAESSRIRVTGSIGANLTLSANVVAKAVSVTLSAVTDLAAEDIVLISSNALVPLSGIGGVTTQTVGEIKRIRSISGLVVTFYEALDDAYLVADIAKVQKITPAKNVTIDGLSIIGTGTPGDGTTSAEIGISALYAENITVRKCGFKGVDYQNIAIDQCYSGVIEENDIVIKERGNVAFDIIQYGIAPKNASACITIKGNRIWGGKHGIVWTENSLGGVGRQVKVIQNYIFGTWAAGIATHESNRRFTITDNELVGCVRGLDIRVRKGVIARNKIINCDATSSIGDGIFLQEDCAELDIYENEIDTARYGIRMYDSGLPAGAIPTDIHIYTNKIKTIDQIGIYLEMSKNAFGFFGFEVCDNSIKDCSGDFIRLNGDFRNPIIRGNNCLAIAATTGYGVRLMGTIRAIITKNSFNGMTPVRTENDTQSVPVAPLNPRMIENDWDHTTSFLSSIAGTQIVRQDNVQAGNPSVTIVAGVITVPAGVRNITVDTEAFAASDDLDTINGGDSGDIVVFKAASSTRTVVWRDGTGNLTLVADFSGTHIDDTITLERTGTGWRQMASADNTV